MLEVYVALTLLGLGYWINQRKPPTTPGANQIPKGERPSMNSVYDSKFYETTRQVEFDAVKKANTQGQRSVFLDPAKRSKGSVSELTGAPLPGGFVHNNMQPFFRGNVNQDMRLDSNHAILENFGVAGDRMKKQEVEGMMFDLVPNVQSRDPKDYDDVKSRVHAGRIQNNVLPFEQVFVGPGLGQGYTSTPTGGFQQMDTQDYAKPKTVDELRIKDKPKMTYTIQPTPGLKTGLRGQDPKVAKNRANRWYTLGVDRLFKTTGAFTGPSKIPMPEAKCTSRMDTSREYQGTGYQPTQGDQKRPEFRGPIGNRSSLEQFGQLGGAVLSDRGTGSGDDYGKTSIQVYGNERDVTQVKTQVSNLSTAVKSIIAPLQDVVKTSRKEYNTLPAREFGSMSIQIPEKIAVHNPNAVMRTTLKETQLHDSEILNIWSSTIRGPAFEGEAKPTIRETTDPMETALNLATAFPSKLTVHDPSDTAKTTTRETTLDEGRIGGVEAQNKANAAYQGEEFLMKLPQGASYEDVEYMGDPNASIGGGDAYKVTEFEIEPTMKEDQHEYMGSAKVSGESVKPMSYADIYEATTRDLKSLVENHEPTQNGAKVAVSGDMVNVCTSKQVIPNFETSDHQHIQKIQRNQDEAATAKVESVTRIRQPLMNNDRLDIELLEPFKKNPYTQSLNSF